LTLQDNAIKYREPDAPVRLSVSKTDDCDWRSRFWEHRRNSRKTKYPGLAQLVARLLWDVVVERFCDFDKTAESPAMQGF